MRKIVKTPQPNAKTQSKVGFWVFLRGFLYFGSFHRMTSTFIFNRMAA